jgi:hypothetical protein
LFAIKHRRFRVRGWTVLVSLKYLTAMLRVRLFVPLLGLGACSHLIHPAAVQPGLAIDVVPGVEIVRHTPIPPSNSQQIDSDLTGFGPYRTTRPLAQLNLSYGWRLSEQVGMQVAASGGANAAPGLDGYLQFLAHPFDAGMGLTLSLNGRTLPNGFVPGIYAMAGKAWSQLSGYELRTDVGLRYEAINVAYGGWERGINPFVLLTLGSLHQWRYGLWFDARWYSRSVVASLCDDNCDRDDLVETTAALGLFVRFTP